MGGDISSTTTLQPELLGFVWCTLLSHYPVPKAIMDNQPKNYYSLTQDKLWCMYIVKFLVNFRTVYFALILY